MKTFAITDQPLEAVDLAPLLEDPSCGALVWFEGRVRDHNEGRGVLALEYQSYLALAESEGSKIIEEALAQFNIGAACCWHRVGPLQIGDIAVRAGVAAAHRDAAWQACRFVIDETKRRVPIWKRERYTEGDSGWVGADGVARPEPEP